MAGESALSVVYPIVLGLVNASPITTTLGCNVYREVPQTPTYPFIVLQSPTETREGEKFGKASKMVTLQVHVYTSTDQVEGAGQVADIVSAVCAACEYPSVTQPSGWNIELRSDNVIDVGDEVWNGIKYRHWSVLIRVWAERT
jgi:hypothetical protein